MRTEKIIFGIFFAGFVLKIFNIPGGSLISIPTLCLFSLLYFPFGFYFLSDKKIDNKTVGFSVLTGLLLSTLVLGFLFNLMHWTGARFMLSFGFLSCIPILVISYLKFSKPKDDTPITYYKNIFLRVSVFMILGLLTVVL